VPADISSDSDPLALYHELVLEGRAPEAEEFCRRHPEAPSLAERIRELESLRADLARLAGAPRIRSPEELPEIAGFRVLSPLGSGGMGAVFLAQQESPRRLCALKLMTSTSVAALDRFRREADLAAALSHPNIAAVYDFGVAGDQPYLATELVHGFSLRALLSAADVVAPDAASDWLTEAIRRVAEGDARKRSSATAPIAAMVALATQVAEALAHAHERGVVHRDVKPSNIIVSLDGRAQLIDFGLALSVAGPDDRLTYDGAFVGSHEYAAPEQLRGELDHLGPWTDTYALGATLYEMLTQRTPFEAATFADRLRVIDEPPPTPRRFNGRIPRALDDLVMQALQPLRERRFQDGEELADALRAVPTGPAMLPPFPGGGVARGLFRPAHAVAAVALLAAVAFAALWLDTRHSLHTSRARYEAQHFALAREVLRRELDRVAADLGRCVRVRGLRQGSLPVPYRADITVAGGRVVEQVAGRHRLTAREEQCLTEVFRRLRLDGVGLVEPVSLLIDVDVGAR
jgi:serine/threonine protein kinase